jgi:hypothetical protein
MMTIGSLGRSRFAALAVVLALAAPTFAGEEARPATREPPHYESPIVSLLFLPVTLLIKIAEVVSPEPAPKASTGTESPAAR